MTTADATLGTSGVGSMRILVCDDDPVIRYLLEVVLGRRGGHEVIAVGDPEAVAAAARDHAPDLVLLDYVMPGLSGRAVTEELRADPLTRSIPVVFLTGRADIDDDLEALGVVDVIEKPFDTSSLADRLTRHVTSSR